MNNSIEQSYVFISYAHANSDKVLPTINAMKNSGIHIWYDDGIVAGSEWPEFIAEKVVNCQKFVLFVSNAYLNSQNCKRELNFAISRKKEILSIFLEDANLSPGMEMQLGSYQAIFRNRFLSDADFFASVCREPFFLDCKNGSAASYTPPVQQPTPPPRQNQTYTAPNAGQQYAPNQPTYTPNAGPQYAPNAGTYTPPNQSYRPPSSGYSYASAPSSTTTDHSRKSRFLAILLAFFFGTFGLHHFYMGNKVKGVITLLLFWTYIPTFIGIFNAIQYFFGSDDEFQAKCQ